MWVQDSMSLNRNLLLFPTPSMKEKSSLNQLSVMTSFYEWPRSVSRFQFSCGGGFQSMRKLHTPPSFLLWICNSGLFSETKITKLVVVCCFFLMTQFTLSGVCQFWKNKISLLSFLFLFLWRIDLPPTHKPPPPYSERAPAVPLGVHASQVAWLCQVNPNPFL